MTSSGAANTGISTVGVEDGDGRGCAAATTVRSADCSGAGDGAVAMDCEGTRQPYSSDLECRTRRDARVLRNGERDVTRGAGTAHRCAERAKIDS